MYTKILRYVNGGTIENPKVGIIRCVDGKLSFEGDIDSRRQAFFVKEYEHYFKKQFPKGTDRQFLEDWLNVLYVRTTYVHAQFVPEGAPAEPHLFA